MKIQTPGQTATTPNSNTEVISRSATLDTATSTFCGTADERRSTGAALISGDNMGRVTSAGVGVQIPSPGTPQTNPHALPTTSPEAGVATARPAPSIEAVKAIKDPAKQQAQVKELFSSLAEPTALPSGEFSFFVMLSYTFFATAQLYFGQAML